jgi:hypothetical protein
LRQPPPPLSPPPPPEPEDEAEVDMASPFASMALMQQMGL